MKYIPYCIYLFTTAIILTLKMHGAAITVLSISGDVKVKLDAGKPTIQLKFTTQLTSTSIISIGGNGGYCCLLSNNNTFEYMKPGMYQLNTIDTKSNTKNSTSGEIILYLQKSINAKQSKTHYVGSVYRGAPDLSSSFVFPYDTRVLGDTVNVLWEKDKNVNQYTIVVQSATQENLLLIPVKDTSKKIVLTALRNVKRGDCIYWSVNKNTETTKQKPFALCWATEIEADSIRNEEKIYRQSRITGDLNPSISPIASMLIGTWYEKRGYFAEALKYYDNAELLLKQNNIPPAEQYRNAKTSLLARLGK